MFKSIISLVTLLVLVELPAQTNFNDVTLNKGFQNFTSARTYGSGVAAADFDNDGDIDIYVTANESWRNQLYKNNGSGDFSQSNTELMITMRSRASIWFDYNGDQLLDLVVAGDCYLTTNCDKTDRVVLFEQQANGIFTDVTDNAGLFTDMGITTPLGGLAVGDINNDGYLDLLISYRTGKQFLFLNNRNSSFSYISESSGLSGTARHYQPIMFDMDRDGWADIYQPVDGGSNQFWLNAQNNQFEEKAEPLNLDNSFNDMGVTIGDFDNDEDFDIYVSNIERISPRFNILMKNMEEENDELQFQEVSDEAGVRAGGWGWGVTFIDADNDGLLDLAATNGFDNNYGPDQSKLWMNVGDGTFTDKSVEYNFMDEHMATTLISLDYDRDGDLDLLQTLKSISGEDVQLRLYENQLEEAETPGNFLVVKPRMNGANHWAIGSTVKVRIGETVLSRPITAGTSFYGQEPAEAHFGIGVASQVDEIMIVWPGGEQTTYPGVSANQIITLTDENALHAPGGLVATTKNSSTIGLKWGHMSTNETGYVIERSLTADFASMIQIETNGSTLEYSDTQLEPLTSYFYRIRSKNDQGLSSPSNSMNATTLGVDVSDPTNLKGRALTETIIFLEWDDNATNETLYTVQRSLTEDFNQFIEFELEPNSNTFISENLEPQTTYHYRVQASRPDGISDFSNAITVATVVLGSHFEENSIELYPNPTSGQFKLKLDNSFKGDLIVRLYSLSGNLICDWKFPNKSDIERTTFLIPIIPGEYILLVDANNKSLSRKLFVK